MISSATHRPLRDRLGREDGMAMMMAVLVTTIMLLLVGGAIAVSVQGSGATTRDNNTKAADEAVEAGLRVATYRLNYIQPDANSCINQNSAVTPANGLCQDTTETVNNGGTYSYYDTPPLGSGGTCVGYPVSSSVDITQRCVTVTATSHGVTRRAQARVASVSGAPLFPAAGVVGLAGISINNQAYINGSATTNGALTMQNSAIIPNNGANSVFLGPSGTASVQTGASYPTPALQRTPAQGAYALSPVDPGNSASVNDDYRITNGINSSHPTPYDPSTGCTQGNASNVCWNPTYRTLNVNSHAVITFTGGVYNFCSLNLNNGGTITIASGAKVAIYIDSPMRAGSGCPTARIANGGPGGSGGFASYFNLDNQGMINNPSQDPTAAVVYIYDNWGIPQNNPTHQVMENNQGTFYGVLYAPQNWVHLDNQAGITGGVAANQLTIDNQFRFGWDSRVNTLQSETSGVYFRTAWAECTPSQPNPNDPESGC